MNKFLKGILFKCLVGRLYYRVFITVFMLVSSSASVAAELLPRDLNVLVGASLQYDVSGGEQEYRLAKSGIKKVNNLWRVDENRYFGQVMRNTFLLKESLSYREAKTLLVDQIKPNDDLQLIFKCQGLDCGSSSGWANDHFKVKQLYGLDVYQYYSAWEGVGSGSSSSKIYHVFYLVQRGNKRVYLQYDRVSAFNQNSDNIVSQNAPILDQLKQYRSVKVLAIPASELVRQNFAESVMSAASVLVNGTDKMTVADLNQMLKANAHLRLRVVGHNYSGAVLSDRVQASIDMADKLKGILLSVGLPAAQLSSHGIGGLAPSSEAYDRVECVLELAD